MELVIKVPGSCGELVQGVVEGVPFLVTCPVNLYTTVTVRPGSGKTDGLGVKSVTALSRVLDHFSVSHFPFDLTLRSEIPVGKGMSSSSADIAATCFAVAAALGRTITAEEVAQIAAGIEPTDGVFFEGVVKFNHVTGECLEKLGTFPAMKIAVFDTGGTVDTLTFHERKDLQRLSKQAEALVDVALKLLHRGRLPFLAQAATQSAIAHQPILPKPDLMQIISVVQENGALGVNVAHSGTVIGVLFSPETTMEAVDEATQIITEHFPDMQFLRTVELISGGYTCCDTEATP